MTAPDLASAATVALAFLAMVFARLSVFAALGPACAIAVLFGFLATVTLLPPVLSLAAKRGIGEPKPDRTRRYWNSVAVAASTRRISSVPRAQFKGRQSSRACGTCTSNPSRS